MAFKSYYLLIAFVCLFAFSSCNKEIKSGAKSKTSVVEIDKSVISRSNDVATVDDSAAIAKALKSVHH